MTEPTNEPEYAFSPDWCMHPGVALKDCLDELKLTPRMFAQIAGMPEDEVVAILDFRRSVKITKTRAEQIHRGLRACGATPSVQFWLNMERNYRDGLKRGAKDTSDDWASRLEECS